MSQKNLNPRATAATIIHRVIKNHIPLDIAGEEFFRHNTPQDIALIKLLCFGTLRSFFKLDAIAKKLLHKPLSEKENLIYILLLVGIFQLHETKIPVHAIVFSTVEAAKQLNKGWATALINKLLRLFIKEKNRFLDIKQNDVEAFYSHPQWLIEELEFHYPKDWKRILLTNNQHPPLWLRVNGQKTTRAEYIKLLEQKNTAIKSDAIPEAPFAIQLSEPISVHEIPGFFDGLCSVQDLAGQFLGSLLHLNPAARVLDACAAPGGKTTLLLEKFPNIEVVALDKDEKRLSLLTENVNRLQLPQKQLHGIATSIENYVKENSDEKFDFILLDAPCSATGVIRRHPDIKFLRTVRDIFESARQQKLLLAALWPLVKAGGKLIYSTCSIFPEENEELIAAFIKKQSDATPASITLPYGHATKHGWQILPGDGNADGFFYSALMKPAENE